MNDTYGMMQHHEQTGWAKGVLGGVNAGMQVMMKDRDRVKYSDLG